MNGVIRLFQVAGVRHVAAPLDPVKQKKAEELGILAAKIFGYAAPAVLYGTGGAALGSLAGLAVSKKGKRLRSMFKGAGIGGGIGAAGGLIQGARIHGKINQIVPKLEAERQKRMEAAGVGGKPLSHEEVGKMVEQGRKTFLGDPDVPVPARQRESNVPELGMQRLAEWNISKKKQDRWGLAEMVQLARRSAVANSSHWFDGIYDEQIVQEYRDAVDYVNRQREEKYRNQFR